MAKFQARHYNDIAAELRETYGDALDSERPGIERTVKNLASMFRADNPRFDAERWYSAIYPESEES